MSATTQTAFTSVCSLAQVPREGGVAALVRDEVVAVFRTHDDQVFVLSNYDPWSRASVLARGIVGTKTLGSGAEAVEVPFVASPMHKQAFDLRTGQCLDDAAVRVPTYEVQVGGGEVLDGPPRQERT